MSLTPAMVCLAYPTPTSGSPKLGALVHMSRMTQIPETVLVDPPAPPAPVVVAVVDVVDPPAPPQPVVFVVEPPAPPQPVVVVVAPPAPPQPVVVVVVVVLVTVVAPIAPPAPPALVAASTKTSAPHPATAAITAPGRASQCVEGLP